MKYFINDILNSSHFFNFHNFDLLYSKTLTDSYESGSYMGLPYRHALGIWICRCSLFYRRELWASKSAGFNSTKSLKICRCIRCPKDRVRALTAPMLMHSLPYKQYCSINLFISCEIKKR